jgi:hypothetical protein
MGDATRARAIFLESLLLFEEVGAKVGIAMSIAGLAGVLATRGEVERAATLFGAAEAIFQGTGGQLQAADLQDYEDGIAAASQLDKQTYDAGWSRGNAMTVEEAVGYASSPNA